MSLFRIEKRIYEYSKFQKHELRYINDNYTNNKRT